MMPVVPDKPKGTQAPIFRRRPELLLEIEIAEAERKARIRREVEGEIRSDDAAPSITSPSLVTPLNIFAAGGNSFEAIVRGPFGAREALAVVLSHLPMEEYGWEFDRTDINRAGHISGFPVWRISREHSFVAHAGISQAEHKTAPPVPKSSECSNHQITGGGR